MKNILQAKELFNSLALFPTAKGKEKRDKKELINKPKTKKPTESAVQIIHNASFMVRSHTIPSRLSSKIKPNGHLKDLQKNINTSQI